MLTTYRGIVRNGKIELKDGYLPEGTKVIVAVERLPSIEAQKARFQAMSQEEWEKPFKDYAAFLAAHPPEADINELSDEELVALVHEVREELNRK